MIGRTVMKLGPPDIEVTPVGYDRGRKLFKQRMDRSDQSRFKVQRLQQNSGDSSVVPVFKVPFLKEHE